MKLQVGIIGTGNVGIDLLYKIQKEKNMECVIFAGKNADSKGLALAKRMGVPVSDDSINAIVRNADKLALVFDATSAEAHKKHYKILENHGIMTVDLTPAKVGKMCIPVLNISECLPKKNVNMVTCGGQATIPLAKAICDVAGKENVKYLEVVASLASKSAGMATRRNIDEFTQTTKDALTEFTGVENTKAIITLNPAVPEITMRNTLYCYINNPNMDLLRKKVKEMEQKIKEYVPGYLITVPPTFENGRIVITVEICGAGDYLPKYAGNLDIITCAAVMVARSYAEYLEGLEKDEKVKIL